MDNVSWSSINDYDDIQSHGQYDLAREEGFSDSEAMKFVHRYSRDNARTPMQWTDEENAGFTTGTPWFYVNDNYREINAAAQEADPDSLLNFYRRAIDVRKRLPAVRHGDYREYDRHSAKRYVYSRAYRG